MPDAALSDPARRSVRRIVDSRAVGSTSYLDVDLAVESAGGRLGLYARSLWATSVIPACELLPLGHAFDDLGAERVTFRLDVQYDRTLRHQWLRRRDGADFPRRRVAGRAGRARGQLT